MYVVAGLIGFLLAYIYRRFKPNDRRTTVESVRDSVDRTEQRLDASDKRTTSAIERSDDIKERVDNSIKQVDRIKDGLDDSTKRLERSKERNIEIEEIVRELRERAKTKTDRYDNN